MFKSPEDRNMETVTVTDKDGATFNMYICEGIKFASFSKTELKTKVNRFKNLKVRDDDVFIASYPKAGRHWIYEIANSLLTGTMEYLTSYASSGNTWDTDFEDMKSPRIIASHFSFEHFPTELSSKKCRVIYITRNIKDTAVSFYSHLRKLDDSTGYNGTFDGFLPLFASGQVPYGSWFEHTRQWEAVLQNPNFSILYLEYEDMKKDLLPNIRKIAKFIGVEENEELFEKIVEKCDFKKMRSSGTFGTPWKSLTKDGTSPICRKGQVGDWKNWFTVAQNETLDEIYKKEMKDSKLKFEYTL